MELSQAMNERKSVRSYTGEPATPEQLERVLTAAYEAPIAMGKYEGIHLTLVTNKDLLAKIDAAAAKFFGNPQLHPLYGAPLLIVVSSATDDAVANANVGIVIENMSLAAVQEGLGSCFIYGGTSALAADKELLDALQLPVGFKPLGSLTLGQTAQTYAAREIPEAHRFAQNVIA